MVFKGLKGGVLRLLTNSQIYNIHMATLEVLEGVGINTPSHRILDIFANAGADVDFKNKRIKIPQHLVEEALKKVPKEITLCGRNPKYDLLLEDNLVYYGLGASAAPYIIDNKTGEFRRPVKKDVADTTLLGDALPNIHFIMPIAGSYDVPEEVQYIHDLEAILNNTVKPIIFPAPGADGAKRALTMAAAVSGGIEELRRRPILSLYSEPASPLMLPIFVENIIEFAKARVPVVLGPAPMAGATGPMTLAGNAVIFNAENLAAMTLSQMVNPGAPIVYGSVATMMNMKYATFTYGTPEFPILNVVGAQITHYYGLPFFGGGGATDSKTLDAQAGAEAFMSALIAAQAGVNLVHDVGFACGARLSSMELVVLVDEIIGMVHRILKGIEVSHETLAVDVINNVGPGGHFMSQRHTLKFFEKESYIPKLFDKSPEYVWVKAGKRTILEVAREKVKMILKEHHPEPLPKNIQKKLTDIVKKAEKSLSAR